MIAPVVHDFFYQTNVAEHRDGFKGDDGEFKLDNKTIYLNEQDELWVRFRNAHCIDVFQTVTSEVKEMVQANKTRANTKSDDMSLQDMATQLRDMPKQEEMMKIYQTHI